MEKSKLQQLVAQVKKGAKKSKEQDVNVKKYVKKITPPSKKELSAYMKENEMRRTFFETLYETIDIMTDQDIKEYFSEFIETGDDKRKIFAKAILKTFDRDQLRKFAKTVTKYDDKYVDDLLKAYLLNNPSLKKEYDSYLEKKAKEKAFEKVEIRYGKADIPIYREQESIEQSDDVLRRRFLKRMKELTDEGKTDKVIKEIDEFASLGNTRRRAFFNLMLNVLGPKAITEFINILSEKSDNEAELFGETVEMEFFDFVNASKKLRKRLIEAQGEFRFERSGESVRKIKERRFVKMLDVAGEIVDVDFDRIANDLDRTRPLVDKFAVQDYASKLWIPKYSSTWIAPAEGSTLDHTFVNDNKTFVHNGKLYYKTNKLFDIMQVNQYSGKRQQKGNILIFYDLANKPHEVLVIYKDGNGTVIVQDEALFLAEKRWLRLKYSTFTMRFKELLGKKLFDFPENSVMKINTCVRDFIMKALGCEEELADNILDGFLEVNERSTLEEFLHDISKTLLIYLDSSLFGPYAKDFQQRLKDHFYVADRIHDIKPIEIIPEIFSVDDSNDEEYMASLATMIESSANYLTENLGVQIYRSINPYDKEIRDPNRISFTPPTIKPFGKLCKNDVNGIPSYRIITYYDGADTYCFDVLDVIGVVSKEFKKNPLTGQDFSDSFLKYLRLFDKRIIRDLDIVEEVLEESSVGEPLPVELDVLFVAKRTDPFLIGLYKELEMLEEGQESSEERIVENLEYAMDDPMDDPESDDETEDNDPETDEDETDEDETDDDPETDDEKDPESDEDDEKDPESDDEKDPETDDEDDDETMSVTSDIDPEDDDDMNDIVPPTRNLGTIVPPTRNLGTIVPPGYAMTSDEELSCENCNKQITNLKTIVKSGKNTTKLINFCSIKCFESWKEPKVRK